MMKLDALQEKPWYLQVALFGGVALLLFAGFWYFMTKGTRDETAEIQAKVEKLQQENAKAQIASQRLNEFKVAYARVQADYDDLKALLPEQRELTMVLQNVQDRARGDRLTVMSFTPKEDQQQDFYSGKPIEVEVSGTYNNVGAFFASIASYQRIVSVTDFKVSQLPKQSDNQTINAKFLLTAYYASPEKLQNVTPAPAAPAAAGANPAQPAAPAGAPALNGANNAASAASQAPTANGQPAAAAPAQPPAQTK